MELILEGYSYSKEYIYKRTVLNTGLGGYFYYYSDFYWLYKESLSIGEIKRILKEASLIGYTIILPLYAPI